MILFRELTKSFFQFLIGIEDENGKVAVLTKIKNSQEQVTSDFLKDYQKLAGN